MADDPQDKSDTPDPKPNESGSSEAKASTESIPPAAGPDDYEDQEEESFKSQADDPTDVWDEAALRAAGIELPGMAKQPATSPRNPEASDSVQVSDSIAPPPESKRPGLSWPLTLGLATILGVAVYFLVRMLR
ncbi:MAG: hypothetical protein AAGF12_35075 [Myxococcota bacterium]